MVIKNVVMENFPLNEKNISKGIEIPKELAKEIKILYKLGVKDYEIEYIIYLKTKQEIRNTKNYPRQVRLKEKN